MRVVFCTPTLTGPHPAYVAAMEASIPVLDAAGIDHRIGWVIGNPYISAARAELVQKAIAADADTLIFLDHDMSWEPEDLLALIQTPGDVVAGTYRFKAEPEAYMGALYTDDDGLPVVREDGCLSASHVPAGFLKVTKAAVERFKAAYPHLCYGEGFVDLFHHGAHEGIWYGEDYAFCRNWRSAGGEIWIVPDLDIKHHAANVAYVGNFHDYLLRQPGGSQSPEVLSAA